MQPHLVKLTLIAAILTAVSPAAGVGVVKDGGQQRA